MLKAYKYRIYPNSEQEVLISKTFGCCRFVYNQMLTVQSDRHNNGQKHLSKFDAFKYMTANLKKEYDWLTEVDSRALMNSVFSLSNAYQSFFRKTGGYPNYKSKRKAKNSYTTNNQNGTIAVFDREIKLPKVGRIKAKIHRRSPDDWKIKSATVSISSSDKYYCSVLYEYEADIQPVMPSKDKVIGLDYKTSCLYVDSNGDSAEMPKYYKESRKKLAKEQRKLKHKIIGSSNYHKQQMRINKIHEHVSNQREDFLHKKSTEIANQYDAVCIEDISIKEQLQERKYRNFRKSTLDNGWYNFTVMLGYKLRERGKHLIKVDKLFPSTKKCSCCGTVNNQLDNDKIRTWECPSCHAKHDRDINAAMNLKNEAIRLAFA